MDQLARLRELKGLSQRALAKESGVSPATVYELENGRRRPNPSTLRKLARALDVEVADLLGADYPKEESRSPLEPSFNDALSDERRSLYLTAALEETRHTAGWARQLLEEADFGKTAAEWTGWSWEIAGLQSEIWARKEWWEVHVFGALPNAPLPAEERRLLEKLHDAFIDAESAVSDLWARFSRELETNMATGVQIAPRPAGPFEERKAV